MGIVEQISLDRMVSAVEKVRQRLLRSTAILDSERIPYAVVGGNAVAAWVSGVDESAVRNTQDVDLLLRRDDLQSVKLAFERAGFIYRHVAGMDLFLDGPDARPKDAVHIIFANEKVRPHETLPNPDVTESEKSKYFRVLMLESLVRIKLTAFRDKDRMHLRDLIDVGLVDSSWPARFIPELAVRLQSIIDTPEG